jgi:hypothetical protein
VAFLDYLVSMCRYVYCNFLSKNCITGFANFGEIFHVFTNDNDRCNYINLYLIVVANNNLFFAKADELQHFITPTNPLFPLNLSDCGVFLYREGKL